jgi:hypothetical protein
MSPAKDFVLSKLGGKRKSSIYNGNGNMKLENGKMSTKTHLLASS